jgi:outer membrane autotransporter protein
MKMFKMILAAGVVALPLAASAQAADMGGGYAAPESEAMGLYLRGDIGWSFLEWSGGADDSALLLGGGVGYRYNDNFRTDLTVDWAGKYDVAPGAKLSTTTVLGNMYFDWANSSAFTPYIGAGLGYGWANGTGGAVDDSGLAMGLAAGVAVDLTSNVAVDAGYRFRDIMVNGPDTKEHQATIGLRYSF